MSLGVCQLFTFVAGKKKNSRRFLQRCCECVCARVRVYAYNIDTTLFLSFGLVLRGELLLALVAGHEHDLERLPCEDSTTNRTENKRHPDATRGEKTKREQIKSISEETRAHPSRTESLCFGHADQHSRRATAEYRTTPYHTQKNNDSRDTCIPYGTAAAYELLATPSAIKLHEQYATASCVPNVRRTQDGMRTANAK